MREVKGLTYTGVSDESNRKSERNELKFNSQRSRCELVIKSESSVLGFLLACLEARCG